MWQKLSFRAYIIPALVFIMSLLLVTNFTAHAANDFDGDGVPDTDDHCPANGGGALGVDPTGCPYYDTDSDGVYDRDDTCPAAGTGPLGVGDDGCPYWDSDNDGVYNRDDSCPANGGGALGVGPDGCPYYDTDGDGVYNRDDACPANGGGALGVGPDGCPYYDTDGDGVYNRDDSCPANGGGALGVGSDGCPYYDTDGDGVYNRFDNCPANPNQTVDGCPGTGGTTPPVFPQPVNNTAPAPDSDDDGVPDTIDDCPTDGDNGFGVSEEGCPPAVSAPPDDRINWQGGDLNAVVYDHPQGTVLYCVSEDVTTLGFLVSQEVVDNADTSSDQAIPILEATNCNAAFYILDNGQYQINIWDAEGKIYEMISDSVDFSNATSRYYDPNE